MSTFLKILSRRTLILGTVAAMIILGGCSTPAQPVAMTATITRAVTKHSQSVSVNVTGGSATSSAGASKISNSDFATALQQSIEQSGLFAKTVPTGSAEDYHLEVEIVRLQQPMMGFSMTVTIEANWTLSRPSDHTVIWQKSVTSTHTTGTGEAFVGVTRLRLATEGAARDNIQDAIGQMSALTFP